MKASGLLLPVSLLLLLPYVASFTVQQRLVKVNAFKLMMAKNKHFQSRSLVDFQKDLEAGKVRHLFPVMNAKERIKKGEIRPSDVPYEQREGGMYNNKDVNVGYVPTGMSVHEWHEFQRAEVSIVWVFSYLY